MSRKVQWAESALADLMAQAWYIAENDPDAAERIVVAIQATGDALGVFATGHPGRVAGTYEKSVRNLPYVIAYSLTEDDGMVSILRVIHAARDWQDDDWPE